jgi:hypothetical protein
MPILWANKLRQLYLTLGILSSWIWGSVVFWILLTFRRNALPPSSGSVKKPSKQHEFVPPKPMVKILFFEVFQGWLYFSCRKVKFLPLIRKALQDLPSWKPANFCVVQKRFIFCYHFLTKCFKYVVIQRPPWDKVDDFCDCWENFLQGCWKCLCCHCMSM